MDPMAVSMLQEYWTYSEEPPRLSGRKKSSLISRASMAMNDSLNEVDLEALRSWDFNCWEVPASALPSLVKQMFFCWEMDDFALDESKLDALLLEVQENYSNNPYHCFRHAFDVTQTLFALLSELQDSSDPIHFTSLEIVAMLISTLCHDVGHVGKTNKFLVTTYHPLALRYNDKAVLEQFHCSRTFEILLKPCNNILCNLSEQQYMEVRQMIIDCILSTDMAEHFSMCSKLETYQSRSDLPRSLLLQTLVHFADISNVTKQWPLAYKWSRLITAEFFNQGDEEKLRGLTVEPPMDRSKSNVEINTANFIKFVCRKFFTAASKFLPVVEKRMAHMEVNLLKFEMLARKDEEAHHTPPGSEKNTPRGGADKPRKASGELVRFSSGSGSGDSRKNSVSSSSGDSRKNSGSSSCGGSRKNSKE